MKEDKQRQKLASWLKLHWHFDHWALYSGLEMDHLSISSFRRLTCSPHKKRQFGVSVGPRVWVFYFVSWIWHRCPDITKHLTSASATIFGPCHLILILTLQILLKQNTALLFYFPSVSHRRDISTFSIIWWFRAWKPYIFWKHIIQGGHLDHYYHLSTWPPDHLDHPD